MHVFVENNTSTSNVTFKSYNITTNWNESTVAWDFPWSSGANYTTSISGNLSTIPSGQTGYYAIDLTAPFKSCYPASMSDFLNKGFLLKYSTTPSSGDYLELTSKEFTPTYERWYIEVTWKYVHELSIYKSSSNTGISSLSVIDGYIDDSNDAIQVDNGSGDNPAECQIVKVGGLTNLGNYVEVNSRSDAAAIYTMLDSLGISRHKLYFVESIEIDGSTFASWLSYLLLVT